MFLTNLKIGKLCFCCCFLAQILLSSVYHIYAHKVESIWAGTEARDNEIFVFVCVETYPFVCNTYFASPLCISSLTCVYIVTEGVADSVWVCVLECNCENCKLIHAKCVCMCVWVCNESRAQYSPISVRDADVTFAMLLMMLVVGCLMIIEWLVECGWMSVTSSLAAIRRRSVLFGAL